VVHFVESPPVYKMAFGPSRQPTSWYGHRPWALHGLQNGSACQLSWTFWIHNQIDILNFNPMIIKHDQTCTFMLLWKLQNKGPFCRASTSPGTQLKLPFSRCHFGEQNPVNRMATWFLLVNGELTVSLKNKRCSDKPLQDSFVSYRVVGFGCQTWFSVC